MVLLDAEISTLDDNKIYLSDENVGRLVFFVNGRKVIEDNPNPEWTLLYYLRNKLRLPGTKLGCGEGGCGACTVMLSKYSRSEDKVLNYAVNACLAPVCSMHGLAVTTVEGIGSTKTKLHAVQERLAKAHGSQCGFCTPGIVMSMYALLRSQPNIKYVDLETALQGNLCRCTGYRPILESFKTFLEDWESGYLSHNVPSEESKVCGLGEKCCKNKNNGIDEEPNPLYDHSKFVPYDSSQEPIFPPELRLTSEYDDENLLFKGPSVIFYRPRTLEGILNIKRQYPNAKIITGNTEVGIEVKATKIPYPILIYTSAIKELKTIEVRNDTIVIGASATISQVENRLLQVISEVPSYKTQVLQALIDMFHWFAGKQIRNVAAIGGNIMTSSPISDLNPILMAAGVKLNLVSKDRGHRTVQMDGNFFTGYRKNLVLRDEILLSLEIPFSSKLQYFKAFKQSKRRDDDIAIVTAAFNLQFDQDMRIKSINLAFGGMGPTTVLASRTGAHLIGESWNENTLQKAFDSLIAELHLDPSAPGGMVRYRLSLSLSLLFKFYLTVLEKLTAECNEKSKLSSSDVSAIEPFKSSPPKSSQYYQIIGDKQVPHDAVGRPVPHVSAIKHATGEAQYCDDIPAIQGELHLALVLSTKAHANILSIDASEALKIPGVEAFFSAADLTEEQNRVGPIVKDEEIFVSKKVHAQGRPLGAIVAKDKLTAQQAAQKVKVEYEELQPILVSIEDAIAHNSYFDWPSVPLLQGNVNDAFKTSDHVIEGQCRSGGQEHFYLETHSAFAYPKEDNEMEFYCSTQEPGETARVIANILGIPNNRVVGKVKRVGGAFGGKEWRSMLLLLPTVIAAHKLGRPVRGMLDRDEDMQMTGNRHPFLAKYKVSFNNDGVVTGARFNLYYNAGYAMDVSCLLYDRAKFHLDNGYRIPNIEIFGHICKTNLPPNPPFRGFGAPQAMLVAETYMRHIAETLNRPYEDIALTNLYNRGDSTHYNEVLTHCTLNQCWNECIAKSHYYERKEELKVFNSANRWKKKGLSILPIKYGVSFQTSILMQAGALVLVYIDGSVLLSHAGLEVGQGLHTKMIQVASRVLDIDMSKIYISETSTDKVPNGSHTAASMSSDLNGMAILRACEVIKGRIKSYVAKNPDGKWEDWVAAAYEDRVSLSATGFYASPKIEYDEKTNKGFMFEYYTYGTACSEVIIDCLTGDHQVLRTDIVMDVGTSLNPAIDIGQIEGAFVQGLGCSTLEELIYLPDGTLHSRGPGTYKLPGFGDIPREFNVSLLKGITNPRAVYSSKAVGEPPLFGAWSVFFAIKEAIADARKDAGVDPKFRLDSPATAERIRMACEDSITSKVPVPDQPYTSWNIIP